MVTPPPKHTPPRQSTRTELELLESIDRRLADIGTHMPFQTAYGRSSASYNAATCVFVVIGVVLLLLSRI